MTYDDLSPAQLSALERMLNEAVQIWDWESSTLYGLSQEEVEKIVGEWPTCFDGNEFHTALAVNNVCADFLGGSNTIQPALFPFFFGATYCEIESIFNHLRPRLKAIIHQHP